MRLSRFLCLEYWGEGTMKDQNRVYTESNEKLILRDHLAAERTVLANERTLLSYIRTFIGMLAAGIGLIKVFELGLFYRGAGYAMIAAAPVFLIIGIIRYVKLNRIIKSISME